MKPRHLLPLLVIGASLLLILACGRRELPTSLAHPEATANVVGACSSLNPEPLAIDDHAVVILNSGVNPTTFFGQQQLVQVSTLTVAGKTYRLVRRQTETGFTDLDSQLDALTEVDDVWDHYTVSTPEGNGEPMFFDDDHTNSPAADYENSDARAVVLLDDALAAPGHQNGAGKKVAILDTGLDQSHAEFAGASIIMGRNYSVLPDVTGALDADPGIDTDCDELKDEGWGHGTHVAGIVHMVAPSATLLIVKALDSNGRGTAFGVAKAIQYATNMGADVINLSMGMHASVDEDGVPYLHEVIQYTTQTADRAVVASAGNQGAAVEQYPAAWPEVISVTSTNVQGNALATFANIHSSVDICAPGSEIVSPYPDSRYARASGGSMAAPFVSGTIALRSRWLNQPGAYAGLGVIQVGTLTDDLTPIRTLTNTLNAVTVLD